MSRSLTAKLLSRREVEGLIADGGTVIILDGDVLKLDKWLRYHPGGQLAIEHMIGRDATDEVTALHSAETRSTMGKFRVGRVEGRWKNFVPPIQGGIFRSYLPENAHDDEFPIVSANVDNWDTDSSVSSKPPSVFDADESGMRKRIIDRDDSASITSESSVEQLDDQKPDYLATQTQREIDFDLAKYPSLDDLTQDEITTKYRLLNNRIQAEGLYECHYSAYAWEALRISTLLTISLLFLRAGWYCTSAAFLGLFWSQLVFIAHDAGHMGITHNYNIDTLIGLIIAAPIGGLSLGWWKRTHNVHHIVTNSPEHDPDNQHLPIFAVNHRFLGNIFSTCQERILEYDAVAQLLVPFQAFLYYPILAFGRFNLYVQCWKFLASGQGPKKGQAWWHRWFEIAGNVVFWAWFGYGIVYKSVPTLYGRIAYVLVSHTINLVLHVQLTLSHWGMSTTDLGPNESFPQKMLRTTMDVDCPEWLDFFHGGLQFQAVHHLFPRIPRHNLRRTQELVKVFCNETEIPYALYTFVDGNKEVVGSLAEVSRQAKILAECHKSIARSGNPLGHH